MVRSTGKKGVDALNKKKRLKLQGSAVMHIEELIDTQTH